jgi:hypothetical protein
MPPPNNRLQRTVRNKSASIQLSAAGWCSQMSSCAEATYFLNSCPGVEMDGDGDGVACESQWCGRQ